MNAKHNSEEPLHTYKIWENETTVLSLKVKIPVLADLHLRMLLIYVVFAVSSVKEEYIYEIPPHTE